MKTRDEMSWASEEFADVDKIYTNGLVMHTCLAVTTRGLPLGLLDQKIFSRTVRQGEKTDSKPHVSLPVEEKESYR